MSKSFWRECIKKFLKIVIPTLGAYLSFASIFSKEFEDLLKKFGIVGLILICCLCFSITLLLELCGMINFVDDIGSQYIEKNNVVDNSVYSLYKTYKKDIKNKKNNEFFKRLFQNRVEINNCPNGFHNYFLNVNYEDKIYSVSIEINAIIIDTMQEIGNIVLGSGFPSFLVMYNERFVVGMPKTLICLDRKDMLEEIYNSYNILVKFTGLFQGLFIVSFDKKSILRTREILEENYSNYISDYKKMLISFIKECSSIAALSGLTEFQNLICNIYSDRITRFLFNVTDIITDDNFSESDLYNNLIAVRLIGNTKSSIEIKMYLLLDFCTAKELCERFILNYSN